MYIYIFLIYFIFKKINFVLFFSFVLNYLLISCCSILYHTFYFSTYLYIYIFFVYLFFLFTYIFYILIIYLLFYSIKHSVNSFY